MKRKTTSINHWEPYVDSIINEYWRGNTSTSQKLISVMLRILKDGSHEGNIEPALIDALFHVADFYCFELQYTKAADLYRWMLEAQLIVNDAHINNTLIKIESVRRMQKLSQDSKEGRRRKGDFDSLALEA